MKLADVKDVGILAALAAAGVIAWKFLNQVPKAYNSAVEAGADLLWEVFGPSDYAGAMKFYTINFTNERHAIPVKSKQTPDGIDSTGRFTFRGKRFLAKSRQMPDGSIQWWAFNA